MKNVYESIDTYCDEGIFQEGSETKFKRCLSIDGKYKIETILPYGSDGYIQDLNWRDKENIHRYRSGFVEGKMESQNYSKEPIRGNETFYDFQYLPFSILQNSAKDKENLNFLDYELSKYEILEEFSSLDFTVIELKNSTENSGYPATRRVWISNNDFTIRKYQVFNVDKLVESTELMSVSINKKLNKQDLEYTPKIETRFNPYLWLVYFAIIPLLLFLVTVIEIIRKGVPVSQSSFIDICFCFVIPIYPLIFLSIIPADSNSQYMNLLDGAFFYYPIVIMITIFMLTIIKEKKYLKTGLVINSIIFSLVALFVQGWSPH